MNDINIFEESREKGEFFSFKEVGDSIQGTYIDAYHAIDGYDNEQFVVVLKDKEGKIWNVGIRKSNIAYLNQMAPVKLGQIIGFRFEESRPSKNRPGANPSKIIRIHHDSKIVDKEWLEENKEHNLETPSISGQASENVQAGAATPGEAPATATPVTPPVPEAKVEAASAADPQFDAVRTLAISKGLTNAEMSVEEQDAKVVEYAEMPLNADNLTQIIIKLSNYNGPF